MGRRPYSKRLTVEQCFSVSIFKLNRNRCLDGQNFFATVEWLQFSRKVTEMELFINLADESPNVVFSHTYPCPLLGIPLSTSYTVALVSTRCFFGGKRYWFACPVEKGGQRCNRRVGKLYRHNGERFGCRECYDLTYLSCKDSHRFDEFCEGIGFTYRECRAAATRIWNGFAQ